MQLNQIKYAKEQDEYKTKVRSPSLPTFKIKKSEYLAVRNRKIFSPEECLQFRNAYLKACEITLFGSSWCHNCGPQYETDRTFHTKLFPVNTNEIHLICHICWEGRYTAKHLMYEAIKVSKKINKENLVKYVEFCPDLVPFVEKLATVENSSHWIGKQNIEGAKD